MGKTSRFVTALVIIVAVVASYTIPNLMRPVVTVRLRFEGAYTYVPMEVIFGYVRQVLVELGADFREQKIAGEDKFNGSLEDEVWRHAIMPWDSVRISITATVNGSRQVWEGLEAFGKIPTTYVTIEILGEGKVMERVESEAENVLNYIKERLFMLALRAGG